jgi:hypothetical protein
MQDQTESWIREAPPPVDSKPVVDTRAVLQQLDRMLKSRHFRNSRRYPAFLAHIVRHTLDGDLDSLKERILGIEVFKRPHDYDTGSDPVVRITAGEVRKRIALYYHDEGTGQELRIELPPGSYLPVFSAPANGYPAPQTAHEPWNEAALRPEHAAHLEPPEEKAAQRFPRKWILGGAATLLLLIAAVAALFLWSRASSPVESMWRPFFNSPDQVLIVVGTPRGGVVGDLANPALPLDSHSHVHMSFNDALALTNITGLLELHRQPYRVQTADATSLDDLRKRPVVLISAFGNAWSGRILSTLRFSLVRQQIGPDGRTMLGSIVDHRRPETIWNFDFTKPMTVNSKDYAIVARLHSDLTEGPVTVIAGLGAGATESAGEFASTPDYLQRINSIAPANWRNKNLELVLEVPMIDGKSGHARIVAFEFW